MLARLFAIAIVVGVVGACAAEPATTTASSDLACSGFGCYDNSPIIAGAPFYELNRDGLPNDDGLKLAAFRAASGAPFAIDVRQARLVGLRNGNVALDTRGMTGATIDMIDAQGKPWRLTIVEIGAVPFWAPPASPVTTYRIRVHPPVGEDRDLCPRPPDAAQWPGGDVTHAIFFEGDRYLPNEKLVRAIGPATAGWFNIACAGTTPAKLHLTRHSTVGANPAHPFNLGERQAMLRAFAAAVCWGSDSFTVKGEKLFIADRAGVMPGPINLASIEGLWDPSGAICLGEQRLVHATALPQPEANLILAELALQCPNVPRCSAIPGFPANWRTHGLVLTTNP